MNPQQVASMSAAQNMDHLKQMLITMAMMRQGTTDGTNNSITSFIITVIIISTIDMLIVFLKQMLNQVQTYIQNKFKPTVMLPKILDVNDSKKEIKSSISIKIEDGAKNIAGDAVIDVLTSLPYVRSVSLQHNVYNINNGDEIPISDEIYARLSTSSNKQTPIIDSSGNEMPNTQKPGTLPIENQWVEFYSYTLDMAKLRTELASITRTFQLKITNKLGNSLYYFNEINMNGGRNEQGILDAATLTPTLHFTMQAFITNRSFDNLFGDNIKIIRKRVEFFKNNKKWYDKMGIPYTLGIMMSGLPGTGKTSLIKCLTTELKRHPINIHLTNSMTKQQLMNLFFSDTIHVTQNGKTDVYQIPIDKRLYILEDIDCQCDLILDRNNKTVEAQQAEEIQRLLEKIRRLESQLSNRSSMGSGMSSMSSGSGNSNLQKMVKNEHELITFSFLLNVLDGILESPGRVVLMSSNFIDKLDKALIRPGRVDLISRFGPAVPSQIIEMVEHRYDTKLSDEQKEIIYQCKESVTPAEIGRVLFENFDQLDDALIGLRQFSNDEFLRQLKEKEEQKRKEEEDRKAAEKRKEEEEKKMELERKRMEQREREEEERMMRKTRNMHAKHEMIDDDM